MEIECKHLDELDKKYENKTLVNLVDNGKIIKSIITSKYDEQKNFFLAIWECLGIALLNKDISLFQNEIAKIMKSNNINLVEK